MGSHEVIEHTADVGVRATGASLAEVFIEAAHGLLEITGASAPTAASERVAISFEGAPDVGALLVDWLSEILYLQDARDLTIAEVGIDSIDATRIEGYARVNPRSEVLEGTAVKAVTYHQLVVEQRDGVWTAQVFFDI